MLKKKVKEKRKKPEILPRCEKLESIFKAVARFNK